MSSRSNNPFDDAKVVSEWVRLVEGDAGKIRDQDTYPRLQQWIRSYAPGPVLEVGCGQGICSESIPLEWPYTGIDPCRSLVERANALYGGKTRQFLVGDIYALPFRNEEFALLYCVAVWHLLDDLGRAAREMSRVLDLGGCFFGIVPNPAAASQWRARYTQSSLVGSRLVGKGHHEDGSAFEEVLYLHSLKEFESRFAAAHLEILSVESFRPSSKGDGDLYCAIKGQKKLPGV